VNQSGNGSWPFVALDTILNVPESRGIYFHLTGVSMPDGNVFEQPDAQAAWTSSYDAALALNNARRKLISAGRKDKLTLTKLVATSFVLKTNHLATVLCCLLIRLIMF